ncbi:MAG: hypothetical protein V1820_03025 [archaeon]
MSQEIPSRIPLTFYGIIGSDSAALEACQAFLGEPVLEAKYSGHSETGKNVRFYEARTEKGIRRVALKMSSDPTYVPIEILALGLARRLGANTYRAAPLVDGLLMERVEGVFSLNKMELAAEWAYEIGTQMPYLLLLGAFDWGRCNNFMISGGENRTPRKATRIDYDSSFVGEPLPPEEELAQEVIGCLKVPQAAIERFEAGFRDGKAQVVRNWSPGIFEYIDRFAATYSGNQPGGPAAPDLDYGAIKSNIQETLLRWGASEIG